MLEKIIVAEVANHKKGYSFHEMSLDFDKDISSLILSDDYIQNDINNNLCYLYSVFDNMVKAGMYKHTSSIERAAKRGTIRAQLIMIYISDIDKVNITDGWYIMKDSNSLEKMLKYCSSVQYVYSLSDKSIKRFEVYGHPLLGDDIERPLSDLV